jgi:phosphoglycolate phosphatase
LFQNIQLVLFDLDGVLLDSRQNMAASWREVQSQLGTDIPFERYFANIGMPFQDIMKRIGFVGCPAAAENTYQQASRRNQNLLQWYPGTKSLLEALTHHGIKCSIVTSKHAERTAEVIGELPITFDTVQTPRAGLRGKPAPDHLLVACASANIDPGQALFVGDMQVDRDAARRAGIRFAHASWGYGPTPQGDCLILGHLGQLESLATARMAA